jgi:uncharacterized protein (DUF58 family)
VRNLLVMIAAGLVAFVAAGLPLGWLNLRGITVQRTSPRYTHSGSPVEFTLTVENRRRFFAAGVVTLRHPGSDLLVLKAKDSLVVSLPAGSAESIHLGGIFLRRGRHRPGDVIIESAFPLGLFRHRRTVRQRDSVMVYPRIVPPPAWLLRKLLSATGGHGDHLSSRRGDEEFLGVREYTPGDAVNRIHWPTTARAGSPMLLELEGREDATCLILLDTHGYGNPFYSRGGYELAVSLAAGIADALIRRGQAVGLAASAPHVQSVPAARGDRGWHAVMGLLAVAGREARPMEEWAPPILAAAGRNVHAVVLTHAASGRAAELALPSGCRITEVWLGDESLQALAGTLPSRENAEEGLYPPQDPDPTRTTGGRMRITAEAAP